MLTRQVVRSQAIQLLPRDGGEAAQIQVGHLESERSSGGDMYVTHRFKSVRCPVKETETTKRRPNAKQDQFNRSDR